MKKDVRKTIALYVIASFVLFSCVYSMLPIYYTIKKTNNPPNQPNPPQTSPLPAKPS